MRRWVLVPVAAAVLSFILTLVDSRRLAPERFEHAREFQRMTGGLGMGASPAIYWDFATFDPRLSPDCTCSLWPVPGGFLFSPEHRMTVWDPPEVLSRSERADAETDLERDPTSLIPECRGR